MYTPETVAITREVGAAILRCELTHLAREPIDVERARSQHRSYEACLAELGCRLVRLPEAPDLPDAVFVEDLAVVLDELAVIARPGAASRRPEAASVAEALGAHRPLAWLQDPATLDGGDVLRIGRRVFVGRSSRTNAEGVAQLTATLRPHGYRVEGLAVDRCLHLKSAVTRVGDQAVLLNPAWVDRSWFSGFEVVEVDPAEPFAANAVWVGGVVLTAAGSPRTEERLAARGFRVRTVDLSELAKAEGAVTCCSLLVGPAV